MGIAVCCLVTACMTAQTSKSDDIRISRVFGPETPGGDYKHPASLAELDNGDLYLAYYGGSGEYGVDTTVFGARLAQGSEEWTAPEVIADTPFCSEGNPVVWQAPDGLVWLCYVVRPGDTWSSSIIKAKISKDGAKTWSDSMLLATEPGMMVRGKPILLNDGDYLLPVYHETGQDRERVGADTTSLFLRHNPETRTWSESSRIRSVNGNLQPAVAQLDDNHLICYCRRGGDYEITTNGYIIRAESHDGGRTWSEGKNTEFPNPNSAVDLVKLKNGHLMLIYNDSMWQRAPLSVAVSTDGDRTYPYRRNIVEGPGPYAYPYAIQAKDEKLHVIFTSHDRTVINHAVFEEDAILGRSAQ
ncbi:MAG TPA: exo-alpha-sialidase [Candidatus Hydrogenedentes bacterium]|nr:exo-alpha-sialidase [Candidatus Hydrogenedentota bacterium]HPG65701.1 exo-alpha-sialidase [Candidatus Hydrogenedentota bacterium]